MTEKFQNKYRTPSNRLPGYDYGADGLYFVTICTKDKVNYFGEILNDVGTGDRGIGADGRADTGFGADAGFGADGNVGTRADVEAHNYAPLHPHPQPQKTHHNPSLQQTEIGKIAMDFWLDISNHYPFVELDEYVIMPNHIHGILFFNKPDKTDWTPNSFGSQSQNLGAVMRAYKSSVKRYANQNNLEFEWQSNYHDRIIRDGKELQRIRHYIINNPANWLTDDLK